MFPFKLLEVYYIKNKKSRKRSEKIMVQKLKYCVLGTRSQDSSVSVQPGASRSATPLDHLGYVAIMRIFNNYIIKHRVLRSRVTVYLPRSLSCANYWNKLNKWHSNWGSSLNPYRLWITIILNITYLIIRILKGVDTKLRVNLWTFCEK